MTTAEDTEIETTLARGVLAGERGALPDLMTRLSPQIRAFIWGRCAGRLFTQEDCDEVVNDSFACMARALANFRFECSVKTWVMRIALNRAHNRVEYNRRRFSDHAVSLDQSVSPDDERTPAAFIADGGDFVRGIEVDERERASLAALDQLPERHREILEMRAVRNMRYDEIADAVGINIGTVKSRIARAREALRSLMDAHVARPTTIVVLSSFNFSPAAIQTTSTTLPTVNQTTPLPYCNNLAKDDRVIHVDTKRPGTVAHQPRETSRGASILWQGATSAQHCDVLKLRLVVNGKPEDVPPCDGEPPSHEVASHPIPPDNSPRTATLHALDVIREDRAKIKAQMTDLEHQFKQLRAADDRLAEAEKALSATTP